MALIFRINSRFCLLYGRGSLENKEPPMTDRRHNMRAWRDLTFTYHHHNFVLQDVIFQLLGQSI